MFRYPAAAVLAALAMGAAAPAFAGPTGKAPPKGVLAPGARAAQPQRAGPTEAQLLRKADAWFVELGQWSKRFDDYAEAQGLLLDALIAGLAPAAEHMVSDDHAAGQAWASVWAAERRAEHQALKAQMDALPAKPPAAPYPEAEALARGMARFKPAVVEAAPPFDAAVEAYIAVVERAARGDADLPDLMGHYYEVNIVLLRNENATMGRRASFLPAGHPQISLTRAGVAGNHAVISLYDLARAQGEGSVLRAKAVAAAAAMRQYADQMDVAADATERDARTKLASLHASVANDRDPVMVKMDKAFATYGQSAAAEREIADTLRKVAEEVEAAGEANLPDLIPQLDVLSAAVTRRVTLSEERQRLITGV